MGTRKKTWIVADTEDNSEELLSSGKSGFDKQVTQIAAIASDGTQFYSDSGDVVAFLKWLRQKSPCKVYFHNLRYDLGNLFGNALDLPDMLLVGGRCIYARWGKVLFHDSFNIWPMSVARIGKAVGLEKLGRDVHSRDYVFRDCEIVKRALDLSLTLAREFGIEQLPATIGSLSVKVWKAMGGQSWFCDSSAAKQAYYGGRVELFQPSAVGEISYCDVNSLYPWAMTQPFPCSLDSQRDIDCEGIALVTLQVPHTFVAPLPVRCEDKRILYPTGKLKGVWTTHEIRTAIKFGARILTLHDCQGSFETEPNYADFISHFYARRVASRSPAEKTFYKLFLNNLYGQQAMSGIVTRSVDSADERDGTVYGTKKLVDSQMPLPEHVNYLHAAYVTSYARTKLLDSLIRVNRSDLIYCDTDSIIHSGVPVFPISNDLGAFKLEKTWKACQTFAPKCYRGDDEWKAKGVPQRLAQKFIQEGRVEYETPFGLREAIVGYDDANSHQLSVWHKTEKRMISEYDKKKLIDGQWWPLQQS